MPNILVSRALPDKVMEALRADYDVTLRPTTQPMNEDEAASALMAYDAILPTLGDRFTSDAIGRVDAPRCKILANFGVGYNHIDVSAAAAKGITVTNTPGAVTDATADIAMALILMAARRAGEGERLVRSGEWSGWHPVQMLGMHIGGKTVGIIGMGRIGKAIARRCQAGFGMDVVFHNRSQVADVVVLAVPGSPETHHLIDGPALEAMQSHSYLVNISRGDVVDEAALIAALQERWIAGAGLDVYEHEPHVPDALKALDNVVLLPHLGTNAQEVRTNMGMMAVENLRAFFAGNEAPNKV